MPHDALANGIGCRDITLAAAARLGYKDRYTVAKINKYFQDNPGLKKNFTVNANLGVAYNIGGIYVDSDSSSPDDYYY